MLTVGLLGVALVLSLQPNSAIRELWNQWRAKSTLGDALAEAWPLMERTAISMYAGAGGADIVLFSDYECTFCRQNAPIVDSILALGIRVKYIHTPAPSNPRARSAALAAVCADREGKFLPFHSRLMQTEHWRRDEDWGREAKAVGIHNLPRFLGCLSDASAARVLDKHWEAVRAAKVNGTPTFASRQSVAAGYQSLVQVTALARSRPK